MIELSRGRLRARISPRGAELQSLRRGDEELMWQPQPGVWHQTAPWLFPFVGRLRGGAYLHQGRRYALPLHGFAAGSEFACVDQARSQARFRLSDSEATRAVYPFGFEFEVGYTLRDDGLHIALQVRGDPGLPFALGAHPGFALRGPLSDWSLQFEQQEADTVWRLQPEPPPWGLRAASPEPWSAPGRLDLHAELFMRDALILDPLRSAWVALLHRERGDWVEHVRLHLGGAPQLGLWARPGAPYVCIEPWWGRDDDANAPETLTDKPQLRRLPADGRFACALRITC